MVLRLPLLMFLNLLSLSPHSLMLMRRHLLLLRTLLWWWNQLGLEIRKGRWLFQWQRQSRLQSAEVGVPKRRC